MEKLTPYIDGFMKEITAIKDLTPAEQVLKVKLPLLDGAQSLPKMSRPISENVISIGLIISVSNTFSFR